jgi:hypothetical protein
VQLVASVGACDIFSNSLLWEYLDMIKPYLGAIGIACGIPLCFFGLKMIKPSVCFAGFLTVTGLSCLLFYTIFLTDINKTSAFWYFLGGGALAGIIIGLLLAKFVRFGAAVLAGWGGFCAGLILNEMVLYRFELSWLFWTSNVVCIIVAAVLAFVVFEHAVILSSACLGAYSICRGVSCYAGHYYNEFTIINLLKSGAIDQIDPYYWAYVGGFVVFIIVGSIV